MITNGDLIRVWKEVVKIHFNVSLLLQYLPGENHEKLRSG
jgi:hypothetical protein